MWQKIEHIELVHKWFHSSEWQSELLMRQGESPHVAIGVNANVLSDWKSLHAQSHCRVTHAASRYNYIRSLIAIIAHIRITHKWNPSLSQPSCRLLVPSASWWCHIWGSTVVHTWINTLSTGGKHLDKISNCGRESSKDNRYVGSAIHWSD